jgi:hypothetical protein
MSEDQAGPLDPQAPAETMAGGGVPLVYVNWMRTTGSPFDLAVDVGYQGGPGLPNPAARLVMTWEHARLLSDSLRQAVEQYEKTVGKLRNLDEHVTLGPMGAGPTDSQD